MKRIFICLANSKKYGGRCIAGIELLKTEKGYNFVENETGFKWIRPVSHDNHGTVPSILVRHINLGDIVEFDATQNCPNGYQSENVLFTGNFTVLSANSLNSRNIDLFIEKNTNLFGNTENAVSVQEITNLEHSLIFIKAQKPSVWVKESLANCQLRIKFDYRNITYDLPVTDENFEQAFYQNAITLKNTEYIYLTISLGVAHNNAHYKLVAGVIII